MSDADTAFAKAQEGIARARREGVEKLDFNRQEFRALDRLPEEIGALPTLRFLNLYSTNVSDLTPLKGLTGLTRLWLTGTGVTDLAPLSGLTRIIHEDVVRVA